MSEAGDILVQVPELDTDDYKQLVSAVLEGEERGLSTGELEAFCEWCHGQLIGAILVGLCLRGELKAKWSPEQDDWVCQKR